MSIYSYIAIYRHGFYDEALRGSKSQSTEFSESYEQMPVLPADVPGATVARQELAAG
jgi:hypothetical protein